MTNFNLVKKQKYFLSFSAFLVILSIISVLLWGLKPGLDFTGGSLLEVQFKNERPSNQSIEAKISAIAEKPILIPTGDNGLIIKTKVLDENQHQALVNALSGLNQNEKVIEKNFTMIGPTISSELRTKSFLAILFVLLAIIFYITFAFRKVSRPVASWKYGICAILALFHDVVIPTGIFAALGYFLGVEVDTLFVTALLTILGFSVHDTIVVFDRIRENLLKYSRETFEEVVNRSVNQTVTRSINTSFTVLLVLLTAYFLGGESIKYFVLTLIIGIVFGTYSSIFVASPILVIWNRLSNKQK